MLRWDSERDLRGSAWGMAEIGYHFLQSKVHWSPFLEFFPSYPIWISLKYSFRRTFECRYPHLSGHHSMELNQMNPLLPSAFSIPATQEVQWPREKCSLSADYRLFLRDEDSPNEWYIICLFFVIILPQPINVYWMFLFINTMLIWDNFFLTHYFPTSAS